MSCDVVEEVVHVSNARAVGGDRLAARCAGVLSPERFAEAAAEIVGWPGYAPTPLPALPGLARRLGIGALHYKDESGRFGLGSFKSLGGAHAVFRLLGREIVRRGATATPPSRADLVSSRFRSIVASITVTCATDGNHGRSVAWGAKLFGCRAVIYVQKDVTPARREAIAALGATVVRVEGTYDEAVRRADADAAQNGWFVVSDTSYPGYVDVPCDVMAGYGVMAGEVIAALSEPPTHVFLQVGVGGLAAAVIARTVEAWGAARPRFVSVEPKTAACLLPSLSAGRRITAEGGLDTVMAGLACGEVSLTAWEILEAGIDDALAIDDAVAMRAMRLLADGEPAIVGGESGVAGLAGLIAAAESPALARALGLDPTTRVVVFGSEGATDPAVYRRIVGRDAA
ncbi:MAG: diaminopropionate ammonia-lyase [Phyllobacteriaceae bacterium]|nr:diaminopropionate ammonia-lyase [Phyllobacteriaceae bacterium]